VRGLQRNVFVVPREPVGGPEIDAAEAEAAADPAAKKKLVPLLHVGPCRRCCRPPAPFAAAACAARSASSTHFGRCCRRASRVGLRCWRRRPTQHRRCTAAPGTAAFLFAVHPPSRL
jgi:hypothetical protein